MIKIAKILPLHIYDYDIQGDLEYIKKKEMYEFAVNLTAKIWQDIPIIVIAHGKKTNFKFSKLKNVSLIWSKYYNEPNKFGLFEKNPAQRSIVYEGIKHAKKLNFTHIIKGRADSVILKKDILLNLILKHKNKFIFTQQTSFSKPFLLGDCFMAGRISEMEFLWGNDYKIIEIDGLRHFANQFMRLYDSSKFLNLLIKHSKFVDLTDIQVIDCRFNWKDHQNDLTVNHNDSKYIWGVKNRWVGVSDDLKITFLDRKNLLTKKIFNKKRKINLIKKKILRFFHLIKLYKS